MLALRLAAGRVRRAAVAFCVSEVPRDQYLTGLTDMLLAACMHCGERCRLRPEQSLYDAGWRFVSTDGWLCRSCQRVDLGNRRIVGRPLKGDWAG